MQGVEEEKSRLLKLLKKQRLEILKMLFEIVINQSISTRKFDD